MNAANDSKVLNETRGTVLATRAGFALSRRERRRGLLGRQSMEPSEALVFPRCRQVHMIGMKFPIDVLFLNKRGTAVACVPDLQPGRLSPWVRRARTAIELPAGVLAATGTQVSDVIAIESVG
jgi:uncharacterized membrane protein (UPF0127 family)